MGVDSEGLFLELARENLQIHEGSSDLGETLVILTLKNVTQNYCVYLDLGPDCHLVLREWITFLKPFLKNRKIIGDFLIMAQKLKFQFEDLDQNIQNYLDIFAKYFPKLVISLHVEKWLEFDFIKVQIENNGTLEEFKIFIPIKNGEKKPHYLGLFPRSKLMSPSEEILALLNDLEKYHLMDEYFYKWISDMGGNKERFFEENLFKLKMLQESESAAAIYKTVFRGANYQKLFPFWHLIQMEQKEQNVTPTQLVSDLKLAVGRSLKYCVSHSVLLNNEEFTEGIRKFQKLKDDLDNEIDNLNQKLADNLKNEGHLNWLKFQKELFDLEPSYVDLITLDFNEIFNPDTSNPATVSEIVDLLRKTFKMSSFSSENDSRDRIEENLPQDLQILRNFLEGFLGSVSIGPNESNSKILEVKGYNIILSQVIKKLTSIGDKFKKAKSTAPPKKYNISAKTKLKLRNLARTLGRVRVLAKTPLSCCTEVRIVANGTIFVDTGLLKGHWHSKNLAVIANNINVTEPVIIDTSGLNGICSFKEKAPKCPVLGGRGQNGEDAQHGESAGNISIICKREIQNLDRLTLRANGGHGGNGQSGGNGGDGKPGVIGIDGIMEEPSALIGRWNIYEGEEGSDGGSGGVGGAAGRRGLGGKAGDLKIFESDKELFSGFTKESDNGKDGNNGQPGDGGAPGAAGRDGLDRGWATYNQLNVISSYQVEEGKLKLVTVKGWLYNGFEIKHIKPEIFDKSQGVKGQRGDKAKEIEVDTEKTEDIDLNECLNLAKSLGIKINTADNIVLSQGQKVDNSELKNEVEKRNELKKQASKELKYFEAKSKENMELLDKFDKNFQNFFDKVNAEQNVSINTDVQFRVDVPKSTFVQEIGKILRFSYPQNYFDKRDNIDLLVSSISNEVYMKLVKSIQDLKKVDETSNLGKSLEKFLQNFLSTGKNLDNLSTIANLIEYIKNLQLTGYSDPSQYISNFLDKDLDFFFYCNSSMVKDYRNILKDIFRDNIDIKKELKKEVTMLHWILNLRGVKFEKRPKKFTELDDIKIIGINNPKFKIVVQDIVQRQMMDIIINEMVKEFLESNVKGLGKTSKFFLNIKEKIKNLGSENPEDLKRKEIFEYLRKLFEHITQVYKEVRVYKNINYGLFLNDFRGRLTIENFGTINDEFLNIFYVEIFDLKLVEMYNSFREIEKFRVITKYYTFSFRELNEIYMKIMREISNGENFKDILEIIESIFVKKFKTPILSTQSMEDDQRIQKIIKIFEDPIHEINYIDRIDIYKGKISKFLKNSDEFCANFQQESSEKIVNFDSVQVLQQFDYQEFDGQEIKKFFKMYQSSDLSFLKKSEYLLRKKISNFGQNFNLNLLKNISAKLLELFEKNLNFCQEIPQPEKILLYVKWRLKRLEFMLYVNGKCHEIERDYSKFKSIVDDPKKCLEEISIYIFNDSLEIKTLEILLKGFKLKFPLESSTNEENELKFSTNLGFNELKLLIESSFKNNSDSSTTNSLKNQLLYNIFIFYISGHFNRENMENVLISKRPFDPHKNNIKNKDEINDLWGNWPGNLKTLVKVDYYMKALIEDDNNVKLEEYFALEVKKLEKELSKNLPNFLEFIDHFLGYIPKDNLTSMIKFYSYIHQSIESNGILLTKIEIELLEKFEKLQKVQISEENGTNFMNLINTSNNCPECILNLLEISQSSTLSHRQQKEIQIFLQILDKFPNFIGIKALLENAPFFKLKRLAIPIEIIAKNFKISKSAIPQVIEENYGLKFAAQILKKLSEISLENIGVKVLCQRLIMALIRKEFKVIESEKKLFRAEILDENFDFNGLQENFFLLLLTNEENFLWRQIKVKEFFNLQDKSYKKCFKSILFSENLSRKIINNILIESISEKIRHHFNMEIESMIEFDKILRKLVFFANEYNGFSKFCDLMKMISTQLNNFPKDFNQILEFLNNILLLKSQNESFDCAIEIVKNYLPINWLQVSYISRINSILLETYPNSDFVNNSKIIKIFEKISANLFENQDLKEVFRIEFFKIFSEKLSDLLRGKISISNTEILNIFKKLSEELKFLDENLLTDMKNESLECWNDCWRRCRYKRLGIPDLVINQIFSIEKIPEKVFDEFIKIFKLPQNMASFIKACDVIYSRNIILDESYVGELILKSSSQTDFSQILIEKFEKLCNEEEYRGDKLLNVMFSDKINQKHDREKLLKLLKRWNNIFDTKNSIICSNSGKLIKSWDKPEISNWLISHSKMIKCPEIKSEILKKYEKDHTAINQNGDSTKDFEEYLILERLVIISRAYQLIGKKFKPRDSQILAVLLFLTASKSCGRLGEISTGEGKTVITAMLAIYLGLIEKNVNIITSSTVLALENITNTQELFEIFKPTVTMSNNCDEISKKNEKDLESRYRNLIIYGDLGSFESHILRDTFFGKNITCDRVPDFIIVDEVDSMLLDKGAHMLYMSHPIPEFRHLRTIFVRIWSYVKAEEKNVKGAQNIDISGDAHFILAQIKKEIKEGRIKIPKSITEFVNSRLPIWIKNAFEGLKMEEGDLYICQDNKKEAGKICTVDKQTGVEEPNMHYSHGLHQALQMKDLNRISPESLKAFFMSNYQYFQDYTKKGNLFGFTGTLGSKDDQKFIQNAYNVDFFRLPRHRFRGCIQEPAIIEKNQKYWLDQITSITESIIKTRSILIICENNAKSKLIIDHLTNSKKFTKPIIQYTSSHDKKIIDKINDEGLDIGEIFVATNIGGRGTDISPNDILKKNDGIHVILSYLPPNVRVEEQAFGRTARAGEKGSCQFVIQFGGDNIDIFQLRKMRDQNEASRVSNIEKKEIESIKIQEGLLKEYWKFHKSLKIDTRGYISQAIDYYKGDDKKYQGQKSDQRSTWKKYYQKFKGYDDVNETQLGFLNNKWALWLDKNQNDMDRVTKDDVIFRSKIENEWEKFKEEMIDLSQEMNFHTSMSEKLNLAKTMETNEEIGTSLELLNSVIIDEEDFNGFAHLYYSACIIIQKGDSLNEKIRAKKHLKLAIKKLDEKYQETFSSLSIMENMAAGGNSNNGKTSFFRKQIQSEMEILNKFKNGIVEILGFTISPEELQKAKLHEKESQEILESLLHLGLMKGYRINSKKNVQLIKPSNCTIVQDNIVFVPDKYKYCFNQIVEKITKIKSQNQEIKKDDFLDIVYDKNLFWDFTLAKFKDIYGDEIFKRAVVDFELIEYSLEKLNCALSHIDDKKLIDEIGAPLNIKLSLENNQEYSTSMLKTLLNTLAIDSDKLEVIESCLKDYKIIVPAKKINIIQNGKVIQFQNQDFENFSKNFGAHKIYLALKGEFEKVPEFNYEDFLEKIKKKSLIKNDPDIIKKFKDIKKEEITPALEDYSKFLEKFGNEPIIDQNREHIQGIFNELKEKDGQIFTKEDFKDWILEIEDEDDDEDDKDANLFQLAADLKSLEIIVEEINPKFEKIIQEIEKLCCPTERFHEIFRVLLKNPIGSIKLCITSQGIPLKNSKEAEAEELFKTLEAEGLIKPPKIKFPLCHKQDSIDKHIENIKNSITKSKKIEEIYKNYHPVEFDKITEAQKKKKLVHEEGNIVKLLNANIDVEMAVSKADKEMKEFKDGLAEFLISSAGVLKIYAKSDIKYRKLGAEFTSTEDNGEELLEYLQDGCSRIPYIVLRKEFMGNGAKIALLIGIGQMAVGAVLIGISGGLLTPLGVVLISEGISDSFYAVAHGVQGNFSWSGFAANKAVSLIINASTGFGGIASIATDSALSIGKILLWETGKAAWNTFGDQGINWLLSKLRNRIFENYSVEFNKRMEESPKLRPLLDALRSSIRAVFIASYEKEQFTAIIFAYSEKLARNERGSWQEELGHLAQGLAHNMNMTALGKLEVAMRSSQVNSFSLFSILGVTERLVSQINPFLDKRTHFEKAEDFVAGMLRNGAKNFLQEASTLDSARERNNTQIHIRMDPDIFKNIPVNEVKGYEEKLFEELLGKEVEALKRRIFNKVLLYLQKEIHNVELRRDARVIFSEMMTRMNETNHEIYRRSVSDSLKKLKKIKREVLEKPTFQGNFEGFEETVPIVHGFLGNSPVINHPGKDISDLAQELENNVVFYEDRMGEIYAEIL